MIALLCQQIFFMLWGLSVFCNVSEGSLIVCIRMCVHQGPVSQRLIAGLRICPEESLW